MFFIILCVILQNLVVRHVASDFNYRENEEEGKEQEKEDDVDYYTNSWVVRFMGGAHKAKIAAIKLGFDPHVEVSQVFIMVFFFVFFSLCEPTISLRGYMIKGFRRAT